jgi:mono/diheme cytochrome c family protein
VTLVLSAAVQGWVLVDSIPGLIGTGYGWIVLLKLALFGALFVFAWLNRYDFAPALLGQAPERARRVLVASIAWQTGFAIAIVAAAVVLSELPPAMHIQALWPFSQRFSLDAVREDPDFKREVIGACLALAGGAVLVATALVVRRLRLAALAGAAAIAWFALPHLDLLFVTAYPTSFYHSPTGFTAATIVDGRASFAQNCVSCHGAGGAGDGPAAKGLAVPPADLTAGHLWMHSDGELFWWIGHGMVSPEGAQVMPGFAATLDEDARWAVIDYIRAHNAGNARKMNGGWTHPIKAPDFAAQCASGGTQLADLRGKFVRLVIGVVPPHAEGDVVTIVAAPPAGGHAADCLAGDETVAQAYAVVCGLPVDKLSGTQFLIDEDGWLRAVQAPGATPGWDDPKTLADTVRALRAQKVQAPQDESMHMKMPM